MGTRLVLTNIVIDKVVINTVVINKKAQENACAYIHPCLNVL
jgi:hypothetical protein